MKRMASANGNSKSSTVRKPGVRSGGYVLCLDNRGYVASLEVGKVYRSLPATARVPNGWVRIVDESGEDYLYPERRFIVLDIPQRAKRVLAARS
jgi:hypothetical protein